MSKIAFHNQDIKNNLLAKRRLKEFIPSIFTFNGKELESLNYIFTSDEYLLRINRQFLHHDFYTDIITFDLSEKAQPVTGEIYISVERVKDNAQKLGFAYQQELHRIIFHGALHLCGYKDKKKTDRITMRSAEDFWLNNYFNKT